MRGLKLFPVLPLVAVVALTVSSCSVTRHLPEGSYLLTKNVVETDRKAPRDERVSADDLDKYIRQRPNKRLLGTNFYVWMYNRANPEKDNGWNRMLRRIGEAPVILDTTQVKRSADNMQTYLRSRGFFNAEESYTIDTLNGKKARVIYHASQGAPYRIGAISYDFRDKFLEPVIRQDSSHTLLHTGDIFDFNQLNAERSRITDYLKNKGYYSFSVNNIEYLADTTIGNRMVNLTMIVKQSLQEYDAQGEPVLSNNAVYRIRNIYINPDYNPTVAAMDTTYYNRLDTVEYRGLNILYDESPRVRKKILRQTVRLYPNYLYSAEEVQQTYNDIMRLGYFRSVGIVFSEVTDTLQRNFITFIGDDDGAAGNTTEERYLDCHIQCTPALRQSYKIELEGTTSSNYYGLKATVGYQNRNLFRGVELFEASVTGGYEFMRVKGRKGSFEVGGAVSMSFPRFILPFNVDRYNRLINPRTKFELSINSQRRPYYHRTISGATLGYSWSNRKYSSFIIRPVDINIVKRSYIDSAFLQTLRNPYLINSYNSQLIAGISGSWVYNNQLRSPGSNINTLLVRLNWETMGNLIGGLTHLFSHPAHSKDYYQIFGIRYAQYFRVDGSISNKIMVGPRSSIVYRFLAGAGMTYGNSRNTSIPYDRLFYSGGSNSMRGWIARTLGPGGVPAPSGVVYPSQLGNLKLEANLEARFPVWGILHGALFFDLGNVWITKQDGGDENAVFKFDRFYRQLGFNTGLGARFDLNFLILRLDWGIPLHDPNKPAHERWIQRFRFSDTVINFGVGYPF